MVNKNVGRTKGYLLKEGVNIEDIVASFNPGRNETETEDEEDQE